MQEGLFVPSIYPCRMRPKTSGSPCDLATLRLASKESRDRKKKLSSEVWAELRLEHNAILREWSYRGTTFVNGVKRRGMQKQCLTRITRASREASMLPPLFQKVPDMRQARRQCAVPRDYRKEIREVMEWLNPKAQPSHSRGETGSMQVAKVLGDKLRGSKTQEIEPPPNLEDADVEDDDSLVLQPEMGVLFCEEILKASDHLESLDEAFKRMDFDNNNQLSPLELATFFRSVGLRIDSHDVRAIYTYLKNAGVSHATDPDDTITPAHFAQQTRELIAKYEKSRKAFFFSAHSSSAIVDEAEKYFRRQAIHETRPTTRASSYSSS